MKTLKGTQTEKNILTAFAGEAQARDRYDFFASQANNEGFVLISHVFTETALQEKEHAKRLFKFLQGGEVEITASYPAGTVSNCEVNLIESAAGEHYEHTDMYPTFANVAEKEGFLEVASAMRHIAIAESFHEKRFLALADFVKKGQMFVREESSVWRCLNCSYITEKSKHAPELCPACAHPQKYFSVFECMF